MDNIDVRAYIINNFKDNTKEEIEASIDESISSHDDDTLIGLGVMFELAWNNSTNNQKNEILDNIKKGM